MKFVSTENIPMWAICYMEYGDPTGLDEEDIYAIDAWINENFPRGFVMELVGDECVTPSFTSRPAFGQACETYEVNFYEP